MNVALMPLMSSAKHDWQTPPHIVERVRDFFGGTIDLDPCTTADNPVCATRFYTPTEDGLSQQWTGRAYINPPYGRAQVAWIKKTFQQIADGHLSEAILLLPARPDTKIWQETILRRVPICFIRGRLQFVGAPDPAPFPSALVYCGGYRFAFESLFCDLGRVV